MTANVRTLELYASEGLAKPELVARLVYALPGDPPRVVHHERQIYLRRSIYDGEVIQYELEVPYGADAGGYLPGLFDLDELASTGETAEVLALAGVWGRVEQDRALLLDRLAEGFASHMTSRGQGLTGLEREALQDGLGRVLEVFRTTVLGGPGR